MTSSIIDIFIFNCIMCLMIDIPFGYGVSTYVANVLWQTVFVRRPCVICHAYDHLYSVSSPCQNDPNKHSRCLSYFRCFCVLFLSSAGVLFGLLLRRVPRTELCKPPLSIQLDLPTQELRVYAVRPFSVLVFGISGQTYSVKDISWLNH